MALSAGTRLGPYDILTALGAGGMGEVYKAHDGRLNRDVAIKVLAAHLTESPQARERFNREARAVAALQHSNICTVYDVGETGDGQAFLVMELLQGETLQQRVSRGPLDVPDLLDMGIALADALDVAHSARVVHRDIKPENIILTDRGPKILDFGLAKSVALPAAATAAQPTMTAAPLVTDPGSTVGTVAYMSPEQLRGEELDARTDLFSFGLVLYEMATGRRAFVGATSALVAAGILQEEPPRPRSCRPDLPERLEEIILKAVEKDRRLRYQHAADIRSDLQRVKRDGDSVRVATIPKPEPGRTLATRWRVIASAFAVVVSLIAAGYFMLRPRPALTNRDTLVLADFVNTTGDPVFDGTLRQGLSVQLGQSPFLSLISEQRIHRTLELMGQPLDVQLTPKVAQEICERTASAAYLEGSIASLGTQYVLGLRATNCRTGDVLDEEQVQAARKEDVLDALSRMAGRFRGRVGESLATIETHDTPLPEATTPSLEAWRAFSAASRILLSGTDFGAAVRFLERATEIDPKFAIAHARLGFIYGLMGEPSLSTESIRKAYALRDRVTDRERFFIVATYQLQVTGNLEEARHTCELWAKTYPRDVDAYGYLGAFVYPTVGQFDKAVAVATRAVELDPDWPIGYLQLGFNHQYSGQVKEAEDTFRRAATRNVEIPEIAVQRFDLAFLKADRATMEREVALAQGKPGEGLITAREGFVLAYSGHLRQAKAKARRAVVLAQQTANPGWAALWADGPALWDGFVGNTREAAESAAVALALSRDRDTEYGVAFALALAGDSSQSQTLATDLETRFPEDSSVRFGYLPAIRALLAVNQGQPSEAVALLQAGASYDLGIPLCSAPGFFGVLYPVYVRGLAYLAAQQGAEAAAEFQKILDHRVLVVSDPVGALARLQLGRAFALSGDKVKARTAYEDFLTLWKDADAAIPILEQAKAEYARLK